MSRPVFRFAPSPNGPLHLGHALSALTNQRMAKRRDGRLLLRIEDIDTERCTPVFEVSMIEDLRWLGIEWEQPVRRQSEHFGEYKAALDRLAAKGLVYPAFMSRGEVRAAIALHESDGREWPRDPDGVPHYPGRERTLPRARIRAMLESGAPFSWRLDMRAALALAGEVGAWTELDGDDLSDSRRASFDTARWGDVVLGRRDIPASYHLCVVLDDALQGVTHVVRGMDLRHATAVHRLLQVLLDLPEPQYHHHRLILDEEGRKLSKSRGSSALSALREADATPTDIARIVDLGPF